uniref:Uncharacterized protein n=1 Tax=Ditylenchus dipsaci TaxID=166011 RepID=A0A915DWL3_9BILA
MAPKKSQSNGISNIRKSTSCDSQLTRSSKPTVFSSRDESFTIYIGAQMKSMHNARILLCERLSDLCQAPSSSELNCSHVDLDSRRLQMLMSLYIRDLTSVVLVVGRDPFYHIQNRTQFAKLCEQSAELHFDSLEAQLKEVEVEVRKCNIERQRMQSENSPGAYDNADQFVYDEAVLRPGDVYITCHSNLSSVQVVYHLVVDKQLQTEDISSRHACIGGLRNIIRLSSKCAVQSISLPLLLVEAMNESMTVSWCMSRAELIFKCLKGFLMEVSAGSSSSAVSSGSTPSSTVHYNINLHFLPKSHQLFSIKLSSCFQLSSILSLCVRLKLCYLFNVFYLTRKNITA